MTRPWTVMPLVNVSTIIIGNKGYACDRCVDVKVPSKVGKKKREGWWRSECGDSTVMFQTLSLSTDGSRGLIKLADGSIRLGVFVHW